MFGVVSNGSINLHNNNNNGLLIFPPQKWNRFGICRSKVRILERINKPNCSVLVCLLGWVMRVDCLGVQGCLGLVLQCLLFVVWVYLCFGSLEVRTVSFTVMAGCSERSRVSKRAIKPASN